MFLFLSYIYKKNDELLTNKNKLLINCTKTVICKYILS